MTFRSLTGLLAVGALTLSSAQAFADPTRAPLDTEITLGGVPVACTGIGQTKDDPKWKAYPVKLEFADATRAYVAGEAVTLSDASGAQLFEASCEGAWLLLKLPVGKSYTVSAKLTERATAPRSASVKAPAHGQATFVLTFPDAR